MTSLTQRSSGLVQRRTEASRNAADKERAAGGGGGSGEDEAQGRRDEQDDDDKGDSKETRLTLMEEVLLLGLKDREVRARWAGRGGLAARGRGLQVGAGRGRTCPPPCPWLGDPASWSDQLVPRSAGVSSLWRGPVRSRSSRYRPPPPPSAWIFFLLLFTSTLPFEVLASFAFLPRFLLQTVAIPT